MRITIVSVFLSALMLSVFDGSMCMPLCALFFYFFHSFNQLKNGWNWFIYGFHCLVLGKSKLLQKKTNATYGRSACKRNENTHTQQDKMKSGKNEAHNTNKENRTLDQMNVNSIYLNVQIRGNNSEQPQQFTRSTLNETINGGETYPDTFNIPKQEHKCQVLLKIQYKTKWRP